MVLRLFFMSSSRRHFYYIFLCYIVIVSEVNIIKDKLLSYCIDKIRDLNKYDDIRLAEIKYGLEAFYLTVSKLIIILILMLIFNTTYYTLWFLVFNIPIRTLSLGFHANTSFQCLVMSSIFFILVPLFSKYFTLNISEICIIYFVVSIGYFIMAPKDSHKKPIRNRKKRFLLKIVSVVNIIVYFILSLVIDNDLLVNLMLIATLSQLLLISPFPYFIFKQKYNFKWFK